MSYVSLMLVIDMEKSKRKKHFDWFIRCENPCYNVNVRLDVTNVVNFSKKNNHSFFIDILYVLSEGLHSVEEMRLRLKDDDVVLYDLINPSYTVMTNDDIFDTCRHIVSHDYVTFYDRATNAISSAKVSVDTSSSFNDRTVVDDFYFSAIPWVDILSVTHPIPTWSKESMSIPRISWGKYHNNDGKCALTLNMCVNHALVDGKPLADSILNIEHIIENIDSDSSTIKGWDEI